MAFDLQQHINDYWFTGHWDVMEQACRARLEQAPGRRGGRVRARGVVSRPGQARRGHGDAAPSRRRGRRCALPGAALVAAAGGGRPGRRHRRVSPSRSTIDPLCPLALPHLDPLLEVRDRIDDALARQFTTRGTAGGLMLIHPAGAGFWSDVHHVLGHALAAEIDGRRPLVHWGETSVFVGGCVAQCVAGLLRALCRRSTRPKSKPRPRAACFPREWGSGSPFRDVAARRKATGPVSAADLVARPDPLVVGAHFTGVHLIRHLLPVDHPFAQCGHGRDPSRHRPGAAAAARPSRRSRRHVRRRAVRRRALHRHPSARHRQAARAGRASRCRQPGHRQDRGPAAGRAPTTRGCCC